MAANNTDSLTIAYLNLVTRELNRYIPLPLFVLGSMGNIFNILVFTRPQRRTSPFSLYFISASIVNFLSLFVGLITPFLGLYNLDPTQKFNSLCKLRFYLRFSTITLSTWFVLFACFDRYLSTSADATIRSWSSLRITKRAILFASLVALAFPYTETFYCYSINQQNLCNLINNTCKFITDGMLLVCNSGLPPLLMVIISFLTIRHIKHLRRIHPRQRRETQLNQILLVQVIVLVLFAAPITAQKIYNYALAFTEKDPLAIATDRLINQISTMISYISNSSTFYIYSLTFKTFRKEVFQIFSMLLTCGCQKPNCVRPMPAAKVNPQ